MHSNPPRGKKRSKGKVAAEPISVSPLQRVREFPNECLCVVMKKLFCNACREHLSLKKSVLSKHLKSSMQA